MPSFSAVCCNRNSLLAYYFTKLTIYNKLKKECLEGTTILKLVKGLLKAEELDGET
jgi:hypothetical protein